MTSGREGRVRVEGKVSRDHGQCARCGSNRNLEFDHIIPLAMRGSNTARNVQLLCADCNGRKGGTLSGDAPAIETGSVTQSDEGT